MCIYYQNMIHIKHIIQHITVVPARGGAEAALKIYIRPFSSIELACAVRQPSPCVRALCETGVLFHMSHLKLHFALHTSHCTLHTPHCTLHTSHSTLLTSHCTLPNPHFTLHTPHFTLHTSHFSLLIAFFTLHTSHCHLQPEIQEPHGTTHTGTTTRCKTHRRNNSRMKRPQPQPPHRRGTFHRRLQPLYTEKHKVWCSGFLPKT